MFCAAPIVAHPTKVFSEKLTDVVNTVIIQTIHHPVDNATGLLGFAKVGVARQHRLFWTGSFHAASCVINVAAFQPIIMLGALVLADVTCGMTDASATHRFSIPITFKLGDTTAPIAAVPTG